MTPRWFDGGSAVIIPDDERPVWLGLGEPGLHPLLTPYLAFDASSPAAEGDGYRLHEATPLPPAEASAGTVLSLGEGRVAFAGAPVLEPDGTTLTAVTAWRQDGQPQPVKQFIHLLDARGQIAAQWDGIEAAWQGWRTGDALVQVHEISLNDVPPGLYRAVTGLYDPESLGRWRSTAGADIIELGQVTVP